MGCSGSIEASPRHKAASHMTDLRSPSNRSSGHRGVPHEHREGSNASSVDGRHRSLEASTNLETTTSSLDSTRPRVDARGVVHYSVASLQGYHWVPVSYFGGSAAAKQAAIARHEASVSMNAANPLRV